MPRNSVLSFLLLLLISLIANGPPVAAQTTEDQVVKVLGSLFDPGMKLIRAAKKGDVGRVQALLADGIDPDYRNVGGESALFLAAWKGHRSVAEALSDGCADLNLRNQQGHSALWVAANFGQVEIIKFLLSRGADATIADNQGVTPAQQAVQRGHSTAAEVLQSAQTAAPLSGPSAVPEASQTASQEASEGFVNAVVSPAELGEYRHGTYPSLPDRTHVGVDLASPCGTDVKAFADGKAIDLIAAESAPNFYTLGYMVLLEHKPFEALRWGRLARDTFYTLYIHLQDPPLVSAGQKVTGGETVIGKVGRTGLASGCHVHFEIRLFPERFSEWGNIYGQGDKSLDPYFFEKWVDPVPVLSANPKGISEATLAARAVQSEFYRAVADGDPPKVREALKRGADPRSYTKSTAIEVVVSRKEFTNGHAEVLDILIDAGTPVRAGTPLEKAAAKGHVRAVERLLPFFDVVDYEAVLVALESGRPRIADLLAGSAGGYRNDPETLSAAAYAGNASLVDRIVQSGVRLDGDPRLRVGTPLMAASASGHTNLVQRLLDAGADPNQLLPGFGVCSEGATGVYSALLVAAQNDHPGVIQRLLIAGADATQTNSVCACLTPLGNALSNGSREIVDMLVTAGARVVYPKEVYGRRGFIASNCEAAAILVMAAQGGFLAIVTRLLDLGANPDAGYGYKFSFTGLMAAAERGNVDIMRAFLEAGASIDDQPDVCSSVLILAIRSQNPQAVRVLLEAGASLEQDEFCSEEDTPLAVAREAGNAEIVALVRQHSQ